MTRMGRRHKNLIKNICSEQDGTFTYEDVVREIEKRGDRDRPTDKEVAGTLSRADFVELTHKQRINHYRYKEDDEDET